LWGTLLLFATGIAIVNRAALIPEPSNGGADDAWVRNLPRVGSG